jgi:hypothetical protein
MGATLVGDVSDQVQRFWAPMFMDELKESTILPSLVNKAYQGEIKAQGDRVRVSQINRPTATRKQVGSGHETFSTTQLSTSYVDIVADQVITAAYEFDDLVQLQSQIGAQDSKIRQGLLESVQLELNKYLYSLVSPSTSSPDHLRSGITDFNASELNINRKLASQARWMKDGGWWALLDPSYMSDVLNAQTLTSSDYVGDDRPVVGGMPVNKRFGFNIVEDNSMAFGAKPAVVTANEDVGLLFHPDFLHLVMQMEPNYEVSSLHSNKQFGYVISIRLIVGAKIGIDGAKKHILVYNT